MEPMHFFTLLPLHVYSPCRYIHVSGDDTKKRHSFSCLSICHNPTTERWRGCSLCFTDDFFLIKMLTQELQRYRDSDCSNSLPVLRLQTLKVARKKTVHLVLQYTYSVEMYSKGGTGGQWLTKTKQNEGQKQLWCIITTLLKCLSRSDLNSDKLLSRSASATFTTLHVLNHG